VAKIENDDIAVCGHGYFTELLSFDVGASVAHSALVPTEIATHVRSFQIAGLISRAAAQRMACYRVLVHVRERYSAAASDEEASRAASPGVGQPASGYTHAFVVCRQCLSSVEQVVSVSTPVYAHEVHENEIVSPGRSTSPAQQREPMTGLAGGKHVPSSTTQHSHFISGATQSHRCFVDRSSPYMQN
jgi:hypothetical protein